MAGRRRMKGGFTAENLGGEFQEGFLPHGMSEQGGETKDFDVPGYVEISITDFSKKLRDTVNTTIAKRLLLMARMFKERAQELHSTRGPPASQEGEYPRYVTGTLHDAITLRPNTVSEIKESPSIWVFFNETAPYWEDLLEHGRKGLASAYKEMKSELREVWREMRSGG